MTTRARNTVAAIVALAVYGGGNGCIVGKAMDWNVSASGAAGTVIGAGLGAAYAQLWISAYIKNQGTTQIPWGVTARMTFPPLLATMCMLIAYYTSKSSAKQTESEQDRKVHAFGSVLAGIPNIASAFILLKT